MSEIPEDIMDAATKIASDWSLPMVELGCERAVASAIFAERERAARIAETYSHSFSVALCHYGSSDKDAGRGRQEGHIKAGADIADAIRTPPKPSSEPTP